MKPEWMAWITIVKVYARWAVGWLLKTTLPQLSRWLSFRK
jgi:hypothetical protein